MVSLPFLHPVHQPPVRSFFPEVLAFALGLSALVAFSLQHRRVEIRVSAIALLPVLLVLGIAVQTVSGLVSIDPVPTAYLAWASAMAVLGTSLVAAAGRKTLMDAIAIGLLCGASVSALLAVLQFFGLQAAPQWPAEVAGARMTANLGQPNRLADYLWLGVTSACYLGWQGVLPRTVSAILAIAIALVSVLSGSRMIALFEIALTLVIWSSTGGMRTGKRGLAGLLAGAFVGLILLTLASYVVQLRSGTQLGASAHIVTRYEPQVLGSDARLDLWREGISIIRAHPLTGVGVGNFRWEMLHAAALAPPAANTYPVAEHTHNIILQWAAEVGIPLTLLVIVLASRILWFDLRRMAGAEFILVGGVLSTIGIHSLLEYPLWFAYFLGPVALLMGGISHRMVVFRSFRALLICVLAAAALALGIAKSQYHDLADLMASAMQSDREERILFDLAGGSFFSNYAKAIIAARMSPHVDFAIAQSQVCEQAMRVWPSASMIGRCVLLRRLAGKPQEADALLRVGDAAFRRTEEKQLLQDALNE